MMHPPFAAAKTEAMIGLKVNGAIATRYDKVRPLQSKAPLKPGVAKIAAQSQLFWIPR